MGTIRYVVVVHGIGEQRQNETVISVVSRCAEARRHLPKDESYDVLTLGMACSQTGKAGANATAPWLEFRGIPQDPSPLAGSPAQLELDSPFLGEPGRRGDNLRFVDLHWADLLQADIEDVGQPPEVWSDGLLGRLKRKNEQLDAGSQAQPSGWLDRLRGKGTLSDPRRVPSWALEILRLLKETVTLLRRFTTLRAQNLDETIFTKFLGDVQLYGEYAYCRGQAVRRFHELMAQIQKRHEEEEERRVALDSSHVRREARYTILAHSLGTIMSFDALLYAHAKPEVLVGATSDEIPGLPFPGHLREEDPRELNRREKEVNKFREAKERLAGLIRAHKTASTEVQDAWQEMKRDFRFLDTSWIERVDSFVTLGSPIDKFLVLWWLNYKHLLKPRQWMDPKRMELRKRCKIRFFNYADEQDPVGHQLDVAATTQAVQEVFNIEEDRVYNRYAVPGLAHTSYWKDLPLFKRILHLAVDGGKVKDAATPKVTWFDGQTYQKALTYAYYVVPYVVLALHFFTFTWAVYSESWHGRTIASILFFCTFLLGRRLIDLSLWWRQVLKAKKCKGEPGSTAKEKAATHFRRRLVLLCALYLGLAGLSLGTVLRLWIDRVPVARLSFIGLIVLLSLAVWWLLFIDRQGAWRSKRGLDGSAVPAVDLNEGALPVQAITAVLLAAAWGGGYLLVGQVPLLALPGSIFSGLAALPLLDQLVTRIGPRLDDIFLNLASLFALAAIVFTYTCGRFYQIRWKVLGVQQAPDFGCYAEDVVSQISSHQQAGGTHIVPVAAALPGA